MSIALSVSIDRLSKSCYTNFTWQDRASVKGRFTNDRLWKLYEKRWYTGHIVEKKKMFQ